MKLDGSAPPGRLHWAMERDGMERRPVDEEAVREAIRRQRQQPEDHDLSLIRERLRWTPDERLQANAAFVRWYLFIRPRGPVIR